MILYASLPFFAPTPKWSRFGSLRAVWWCDVQFQLVGGSQCYDHLRAISRCSGQGLITHQSSMYVYCNCLFFWCHLHVRYQYASVTCVCILNLNLTFVTCSELFRKYWENLRELFTSQGSHERLEREGAGLRGEESIPESTKVFYKDLNAITFLLLASPNKQSFLFIYRRDCGQKTWSAFTKNGASAWRCWMAWKALWESTGRAIQTCLHRIPACPSQPGASRPGPQWRVTSDLQLYIKRCDNLMFISKF